MYVCEAGYRQQMLERGTFVCWAVPHVIARRTGDRRGFPGISIRVEGLRPRIGFVGGCGGARPGAVNHRSAGLHGCKRRNHLKHTRRRELKRRSNTSVPMHHPPTESQGSPVASLLDWAAFQGSVGGGGASDVGPNMSTRSSMADYTGNRKP